MVENKYETYTLQEVETSLSTSSKEGLSEEEAKLRLEKYGPNQLKEKKKKSFVQSFFEQMKDPMIYVLFAAVAVMIGLSIYETVTVAEAGWVIDGVPVKNRFIEVGDWPDVIIIFIVILLNALIGAIQEQKAQTSLDALKKMSSPETTVIRGGKRFKVKSSELVIGDLVVLEEGDTIGADLRLSEAVNLKANESSLTGESLPIEKNSQITFSEGVGIGDRVNMVYMSSPVTYGRGQGIVVNTAMNTEIGKIATSLDEEEDDMTPLQKVLARLSKTLGIITIFIIAVVFIVEIIWLFVHNQAGDFSAWVENLLSAVALAVAAIPEGLAAVVTIVLSIGVQRMVKANTVVRKLPSVETLGAVSVVCSDKTGTLTQNKMTVLEAYVDTKLYSKEDFSLSNSNLDLTLLAKGMSLCSNATVDEGLYGDPTEIALVAFANEFNLHKAYLEELFPRIEELPFDSVRKLMSTRHREEDKFITYTKGALDSILAHATGILINGTKRPITEEDIKEIYSKNLYFSDKALRVLALAYSKDQNKFEEENLVFVGLVAMIDPPREEAKPAVAMFKDAGITTVMITGDHKDTAFAIAHELGIAESKDQCLMGQEISRMSDEELREAARTVRVFARVSPENKVSIVKAFKANGNIVAMTGDGVNDAPSLKAADIGIAMGITGTDVAKGAADMVLTDDNFASIEKAVEEGRGIYANIKKTVLFLLSSNIAEVLAMFVIICIGFPSPFIAIHLLWVNLITDSLPAVALGMDPKDPASMKEKPRDPKESIFARGGYFATIGYGAVITLAVILSYFVYAWANGASNVSAFYEAEANITMGRTISFTTLAFAELIHMFGMSSRRTSFFKTFFVNIFKKKNLVMGIALLVGVVLQIAVIEIPFMRDIFSTGNLGWKEWLIVIGFSLSPMVVHEIMVIVNLIRKK